MADGGSYASNLRRELCSRNAEFARRHGLDHVPSYGREPVIVYAPKGNEAHGNFFPASYKAIQKNASWRMRLNKVHTQGKTSLPKSDRRWRELDSCVSSDALLMNIFCCPRVLRSRNVAAMLGVDPDSRPQFGYRPRVPLSNGHIDRTEVDLKLGDLLIEAKLTESGFQTQSATLVETYRDLEDVFDVMRLPRVTSLQPVDPFPDYESEPAPLIPISIILLHRLNLLNQAFAKPISPCTCLATPRRKTPNTSPTNSSATFLLLTPTVIVSA